MQDSKSRIIVQTLSYEVVPEACMARLRLLQEQITLMQGRLGLDNASEYVRQFDLKDSKPSSIVRLSKSEGHVEIIRESGNSPTTMYVFKYGAYFGQRRLTDGQAQTLWEKPATDMLVGDEVASGREALLILIMCTDTIAKS